MKKSNNSGKKVALVCLLAIVLLFALASVAMASGSGMPWEKPMNSILESIQGPVAKIIGVIAIVATGLGLAFGEGGGGMRKMLMIVFGLSIAFSATSFFMTFFNFSGGIHF